MKLWSYWYPDVRPHVVGCPDAIIEHELRRAAQSLFAATRAWQVTLATVAVPANTSEIAITPDAGQEIVRVESALYDGKQMEVMTPEVMESRYSDDWRLHTGTPDSLVQFTPGVVVLHPIPTAAAAIGLKLRISVRPADASMGIPDELAVRFRDEMHTGAKARLMAYPNVAWTNLDMAAVNMQMFAAMSDRGNASAARSFGQSRIPSRPRWC